MAFNSLKFFFRRCWWYLVSVQSWTDGQDH